VTRAVTVRESEYGERDRALILADWEREHEPRGSHGVLVSEATDPKFNPYSPDAEGQFVAEPIVDFAQAAIDRALEARRKLIKADEDWPLLWPVHLERSAGHAQDEGAGPQLAGPVEGGDFPTSLREGVELGVHGIDDVDPARQVPLLRQ